MCLLLLTVFLCAPALAQPVTRPAASQPGAAQVAGTALEAVVKEVAGVAQWLAGVGAADAAATQPAQPRERWEPLKVDQRLPEQTIIRTGFRSRVVLAFADNSQVVIDRATKMGIGQFRQDGGLTRTNLGIKYGAIEANVSRAAGPSNFSITTPVATAAVAGTSGAAGYTGDFGFALSGWTGVWAVRHGWQRRAVRGGEMTDDYLTMPIEIANQLAHVQLGDTAGGMGRPELWLIQNFGGGRQMLKIFGPFGDQGVGPGVQAPQPATRRYEPPNEYRGK